MKIEEVKKLDDGVSNITIEGKIIKTPKEPRDSEYGWSQMIILKDDTDEISSWINIKSAEDAYKVGQYIKIKGKVSKYIKGGKPGISLNNGNVIDEIKQVNEDVSQEQPITQPNAQPINQPVKPIKSEKDMDKVWEDKDLRMARESALKNIAQYVVGGLVKLGDRFDYAYEDVDFIYNGLEKITSEAITKEFGGTTKEIVETVSEKIEGQITEGAKANRIAQAKEIVNQASQAQKDMVEKIIKSRYITEKEVKKIGDLTTLTKENASKYISYWFGDGVKVGERAGREIEAQGKEAEQNPFVTKSEPLERRDNDNDASLSKDMLIEKIQELRKDLHLEDDVKFTKELGCNINFKGWTEKQLTELKDKLKVAHWVKK